MFRRLQDVLKGNLELSLSLPAALLFNTLGPMLHPVLKALSLCGQNKTHFLGFLFTFEFRDSDRYRGKHHLA